MITVLNENVIGSSACITIMIIIITINRDINKNV